MLSQAYRMSVYPLMTRYAMHSPEMLARLFQRSIHYLGVLVFPIVAGIILLSDKTISLIFGSGFQASTVVLRILVLILPSIFLNVPNSRMMLVHDRQNLSLLFLLLGFILNVLLNLALDPIWGASGAAIARLSSTFLYFGLNSLFVVRHLNQANALRSLIKPVFATLVMSVIVWLARDWSLLLSICVGITTYSIALLLIGGILPAETAMIRRILNKRQSWFKV